MKRHRSLAICFVSTALCLFTAAQDRTASQTLTPAEDVTVGQPPDVANYNLSVPSTVAWVDSQMDLHAGDVVQITATADKGTCNPEGLKGAKSHGLLLPSALPGALIGKLGSHAPFLLGATRQLTMQQSGRLYLGMNAATVPPCSGAVSVIVQVTGATTKTKLSAAAQSWLSGQFGTTTPSTTKLVSASDTPLEPQLGKDLESLPRRTNDQFKNPGDMVNFVVVGSQEQLQSALTAANWRVADQIAKETLVNAIRDTYQNKDYLQMPMSTLYLFERAQDFGYELAEVYAVLASRHHFRIWKSGLTWNGQPVWVGAGTHDIGFERDPRNGLITHKIHPAVDRERDFIGETLEKAGQVKTMNYYLPSNPLQVAKNATGSPFHSDGRLLIIFLRQ